MTNDKYFPVVYSYNIYAQYNMDMLVLIWQDKHYTKYVIVTFNSWNSVKIKYVEPIFLVILLKLSIYLKLIKYVEPCSWCTTWKKNPTINKFIQGIISQGGVWKAFIVSL